MIWDEIEQFIQSLSTVDCNSTLIISLLESFVQLSQIFGVEKSHYLIQQCVNCINNYKDFRVRLQVVKTLTGISAKMC
jgi:hypothetical protein